MESEDYARLRGLFLTARGLSDPERAQFLDDQCAGLPELREELDSLLSGELIGARLLSPVAHAGLAAELLAAFAPGATEGSKGIAAAPVLPHAVGRYRVLDILGEGGMGIVYLAEQDSPRRRVALKLIRPGLATSQTLRRFEREAAVLGQLQHPGIARCYEAGVANVVVGEQRISDCSYIAMEYVDGVTPAEYIRQRSLGIHGSIELVALICDAIEHAHAKGIIHRDLKPGNVLIDGMGQPKVLDFGVAGILDEKREGESLLTASGQILGTMAYMSPDQLSRSSGGTDHRYDIYSLGVILYELLSGQLPHEVSGKSIAIGARMIQEIDPPALGLLDPRCCGDVETMVAKALEKDPVRRYQTAAEFATDLRRFLRREPIGARPPSAVYLVRQFVRRHPGLMAGLLSTCLVLLAGLVIATTLWQRADRSAIRAEASEGEALRVAYRSSTRSAAAFIEVRNMPMAAEVLASAPEALRGWEWHVLSASLAAAAETTHLEGELGALAPLRDGDVVAAVLRPGGADILELPGGQVRARLECEGLTSVALSRDATRLAGFVGMTEAVVYDVSAREVVLRVPVNQAKVIRLSGNGKVLAVCGAGLSIYHGTSASDRVQVPLEASCFAADLSTDGSRMALLLDHPWSRVAIVDGHTGDVLAHRELSGQATGVAWSESGARLAVPMAYGGISILEGSSLETSLTLRGQGFGKAADNLFPNRPLFFSGDARLATVGGDHSLCLWDLRDGRSVAVLHSAEERWAVALTATRDGRSLLTGHAHSVDRFDLHADLPLVLRGHERFLYAVAFSADGQMLASGGGDDALGLWDARTGERLAWLQRQTQGERDWVGGVGFSADGSRLVADSDGLTVWDPGTGERLQWSEGDHLQRIEAMASMVAGPCAVIRGPNCGGMSLSADGGRQARPELAGGVRVLDVGSGEELAFIEVHRSVITASTFSPDARRLAGAVDGIVRVWDIGSGKECSPRSEELTFEILAIAWSPDGRRIAAGGRNGLVHILDADTLRILCQFSGHGGYVSSLAWSPDGTRLASASGDATIRIWDTVPRAERREQAAAAARRCAAMTPQVDRLLAELGTPAKVAAALRADQTLDDDARSAAVRVLLSRAQRK